jgi:hypothetical protein
MMTALIVITYLIGWILTARYAIRVMSRKWPSLPTGGGDLGFALSLSMIWPLFIILLYADDPQRRRFRFTKRPSEDTIRRFAGLPPKKR